jgi:cytochrome P450
MKILDTSSEFIFGESMDALSCSESSEKFMDAFAYAQRGVGIRAMLGKFRFLHRDKKWWDACKQVTDFVDQHVEKAISRIESKEIQDATRIRLVDEMAKDTQDRLTLRSHILSVFSPGHDGAAIALSNAFFHLARNPGIWTKLQEEIAPTRDQPLTYELLSSYKYVNHVIRESEFICLVVRHVCVC